MKWNIYNIDNGNYIESVISYIQPQNSTNIEILIPVKFAKFTGVEWIDNRTPEEINTLNQQKIEELNQLQYKELSKTDWVYIRERELGVEIPEEILKQRQEIRDKYIKLKEIFK